ncbi:MAG: proline dehydrogenase [Ignavibacteriota bacterium]|nr:proline dehydrogenase [Ignavibacteriota bacterium]MBW7843360.1 proline dehydrogenase family protein [Ignavibacterium sp.]MCO6446094.1 proline dehydrogenase family protein [Ignavibacterium album]MCZ2267613.1 proline dehydrogenase family protein [Ignavibacteriales bacterium]MDX9712998.1 proline dehydrogenase family protein [Ignavibacteriaceae bacterium]
MEAINHLIVKIVQLMPKPVVGFFSKKYIAGVTLQAAVDYVKKLNSMGIYATMDVLGESVANKEEAIRCKNEAIEVLEAIEQNKLKANLSIKPTQMGLAIDEEFAFQQILEIVQKAEQFKNFVRIDMEDSPFTDKTINVYKRIFQDYKNVGIVIQSYMRRSYDDVITLNKIGTNYRLCKGIYVESASIAYKDKQEVRNNYLKLLDAMFKDGNYVGIATHDKYLIDEAYKRIKEKNISKDKFEFQMLLGVREDLRDKINSDGYKIRIYVPFGKDWYAYSVRRLKENPSVAGHIAKSFLTFGKR